MSSAPHITSLGGNGGNEEALQATRSPPAFPPLQHVRVAHRRIHELQQMQDVGSPAIAPLSPPTHRRESSGSHHPRTFLSASGQPSIVDSVDVVVPNGPRHATMDILLLGTAASDSTDGSSSSSATKSFCMSPGQVVRIQLPKGDKKRQHLFSTEGDECGEGGARVAFPPVRANSSSNLLSATSARGIGPAAPFVLTPSAKSTMDTPDAPRESRDDVDSFQSSPSPSSARPEDLARLQGPPRITLAPLVLPSPRAASAASLCPPEAFIMQVSRRLSAGRDSNGSPAGEVEEVTFFDENIYDH